MPIERLHGTCIAIETDQGPVGALLRADPGGGKSDLAFRLINKGAKLVADDQVELSSENGVVMARAPENLKGSLEVRGFGVAAVPHVDRAPVALVVDLVTADEVERLPSDRTVEIVGQAVPVIALAAFEASTEDKVLFALRARASAMPPAPSAVTHGEHAGAPPDGAVNVVLVTGLSGAGRTTALKALEDQGYDVIDNLPLRLVNPVIRQTPEVQPLAVGVDSRNRDFSLAGLARTIDELRADDKVALRLVFLEADEETLQRRFTETRRRHPMAEGRPLRDGLAAERNLLEPLRSKADVVLDTSLMTARDFAQKLTGVLEIDAGDAMTIFVTSFSFRRGIPREADMVFDVRFLRNPHYEPALRNLTGLDAEVADFVAADPGYPSFFEHLTGLIEPLLPRYQAEGKSYLTIAFGCTGGQHRSVTLTERLALWLDGKGWPCTIGHRDLPAGL